MTTERIDIGKRGEAIAREHIQKLGYTILVANFRCKVGEVDIIAKDQHIVVFVEVRTVTSAKFGPAYNTVTYRKQHQVKRAALFYISQHNLVNTQFRFDVIGITLNQQAGDYQLDHIQNAFV